MTIENEEILLQMLYNRNTLAMPNPEVDSGNIIDAGYIQQTPVLFPKGEYPHTVDLEILQYIPQYFCDLAICPNSYKRVIDMYMYWGWTGACLDMIKTEYEMQERELPISKLLNHVETLLRFALEDAKGTLMMKYSQFSPYELSYWLGDSRRATSYMAFAVLEGLADELGPGRRDYGEHLRTVDTLTGPAELAYLEVDMLHRPTDPLPSYREALQQKAPDYIKNMNSKLSGFFDVLREVRNAMLHGDGAGGRFSACVVTLCCMLVWGTIDETTYERIRSNKLGSIARRLLIKENGRSWAPPIYFYPLTGAEMTIEEAREQVH
ncbi:hypothetical protein [Haladaptatus sp. DYF46]|uniref:hypothetical protein n=1 Tax=Haladaptatus sp. DYF46 TaxID=2886041 RepID=UPI001E3CA63C|nr:hypothetical protein [Haladaptatus sp. DYF46]